MKAALSLSLGPQKLSLSRLRQNTGATLVELLVVLLVLSILSSAVVPLARTSALRAKETQLREDIYRVRAAIDAFQKDWREGVIALTGQGISADGFPTSWEALVGGVPSAEGTTRRYLRAVPENPFASDPEDPWRLIGYRDTADATRWNGMDIFDIRARTDRIALDGSEISDW